MTVCGSLGFAMPTLALDVSNLNVDSSDDILENGYVQCQTIVVPTDGYPRQFQTPLKEVSGGIDRSIQWTINKVGTNYGWATNGQVVTNADPSISTYTWEWTGEVWELEAGETYQICASGIMGGYTYRYYGTTASSYDDGQFGTFTNGYSGVVTTTHAIADLEFIFTMQTADNYVDFYSKPDPRSDFDTWVLNFAIQDAYQSTADGNWSLVVGYGLETGTTLDDYVFRDYGFITQDAMDDELAGLVKRTPSASSTDWYARAFIVQSTDPNYFTDDNVIASSDEYEFTINSSDISGVDSWYISNTSVSTTDDGWQYSCDATSGFFNRTMCNMFVLLFYPRQSDFERFLEFKTRLEDKPPFGYISVYSSALEEFETATSTTSTIDDASHTLPLQSLGSLSLVSTFKTILGWIVWIAFAMYVFKRFKHFVL